MKEPLSETCEMLIKEIRRFVPSLTKRKILSMVNKPKWDAPFGYWTRFLPKSLSGDRWTTLSLESRLAFMLMIAIGSTMPGFSFSSELSIRSSPAAASTPHSGR